jgi:cell pole-organizing protein PopZ
MTDRRGRSGREAIVSDPTLATEEAEVVGARVHARFVDRAERGEHLPSRPASSATGDEPPAVEAKLQLLRGEFEDALREIGARIRAVGARADEAAARADAAAVRAARAEAAGEALAGELARLSSVLPPDVAVEVDAAVDRFVTSLRTA